MVSYRASRAPIPASVHLSVDGVYLASGGDASYVRARPTLSISCDEI